MNYGFMPRERWIVQNERISGKAPEKYRTVIHLFYYENYSIKEIADILKISESNVKVRLNRGRTVLRDTLKEAWDYEQSE